MKNNIMTCVIDDREPTEKWIPLLEEVGFKTSVKRLDAGDLIINDKLVFSLKSVSDYLTSNHSSHLHNEIGMMILFPPRYFIGLIVWERDEEGKWTHGLDRKSIMSVKQTLETVNALYLPCWYVKSRKAVVELVYRWGLKTIDKDFPYQFRREVEFVDKKYPTMVKMLAEISGIGVEIATLIHKKYPKMEQLIPAIRETHIYDKEKWKTKKEWRENHCWYIKIDKLGKKKADSIAQAIMYNLEGL